ncbi:carbohydrate ABC transporter permease [Paenibacillus aceris]|uniref:Aldouronate transport system permease protein n=1 Tax=Paenibacillus aceris TaxID=869555 RepID=A0ABS4HX20_9BACL|nr:carbohydrate ABC transporter permease [Paenibacillus aceris]MBP1963202.1 putative aldouronate transport system permease protein [Paenibacillus aceris]NHW38681.1 carbohydrate ABC transporter permease [Paenibacillus aceris]
MKRSFGEHFFDIINAVLLISLSIITIYPLIYVLFASFSDPSFVVQNRGLLFYPHGFTTGAYHLVLKNPNIGTAYLNTLFYVVVGTALNILLTSLGAYGLSRKNVMWKNAIMFLVVFTMFFDGGLISMYMLVNNLGMLDTRWAIIIPSAVSAFNLIVMRTAFQAVPVSLEESARIDGANDWTILFRVVLPLSMPVVAVMILFYGVSHWNAWFSATIYLQTRDLLPLQIILREILIANDTSNMLTGIDTGDKAMIGETIKYATIIISTVPILFLYPFLQKYFVNGVMIGAVKE